MAYKNQHGENLYIFGWLQAKPGSNDFTPTSGGNSVWAVSKRAAIQQVNRECKQYEEQYPTHYRLRVNPDDISRVTSRKQHERFDEALRMLSI